MLSPDWSITSVLAIVPSSPPRSTLPSALPVNVAVWMVRVAAVSTSSAIAPVTSIVPFCLTTGAVSVPPSAHVPVLVTRSVADRSPSCARAPLVTLVTFATVVAADRSRSPALVMSVPS